MFVLGGELNASNDVSITADSYNASRYTNAAGTGSRVTIDGDTDIDMTGPDTADVFGVYAALGATVTLITMWT